MSTLVIKNLPDDLHARLKAQAERNRRSVTMEVVTLIEQGTTPRRVAPVLSPPVRLKGGPLTDKDIEAWTNAGRP
jgi:plasmid stability protein